MKSKKTPLLKFVLDSLYKALNSLVIHPCFVSKQGLELLWVLESIHQCGEAFLTSEGDS